MLVSGVSHFHNFKELNIKKVIADITYYSNSDSFKDSKGYSINFKVIAKSSRMSKYHLCYFTHDKCIDGDGITYFHLTDTDIYDKLLSVLEYKNHYEWIKTGNPFNIDDIVINLVKSKLKYWLEQK